ncbi:hypothetical protein L202_01077 [Cryptococcus amylolentus CBS 6039]|uniref:Uncharacterized protein n=1 Tax=Cryptococcus amylolentus CBS 6039 TaxID=1295533 RepID=A0A1E3I369_9TREE|nr:hypothetical protein L202_01077 [Cryptococcus amylolentus CBS 6039]ODN82805.1 hypothetical protein L202_01077 [Cryptococcus amylolentus CBS 6039]
MPDPFGSFRWICSHTVLPQCNLFFYQYLHDSVPPLTTLFPNSSDFFDQYNITGQNSDEDPVVQAAVSDAGTGIGSNCEIARVGHRGSNGDIALIVLSALALFTAWSLAFRATRRYAAVGRTELRLLLLSYGLYAALQAVTMSSVLEQGGKALAILSAIHVAVGVVTAWLLLGNALIATQVVEDGTAAAIVPLTVFSILFFVPTLYISLDTAFHWTSPFNIPLAKVAEVKSIALFILTLIVPAAAVVLYLVIMLYIVVIVLDEVKPAFLYTLSFLLFAGAQIIFFLASQPLCNASNGKINSAFLASLLQTLSIGSLYLAWVSITEDDWGQDEYGMY